MKDVTDVKGLASTKTPSRIHLRCAPRPGVTYMDLYVLQMEQQRLEKELSRLAKRRLAVVGRLEELRIALASGPGQPKETAKGEEEKLEASAPQWPRMKLEY